MRRQANLLVPYQVFDSSLEKPALGFLTRQRQRPAIGFDSLCSLAQAAAEIGTGRVNKVIVGKFAAGKDYIDQGETSLRPIAHGDSDGAIEFNNGRGLDAQEHVVESDDLMPIRLSRGGCFGMNGCYRGL